VTKVLYCSEVTPGCTKVIRGETAEQVLELGKRHAELDHGHNEHPAEKVAEVVSKIRDE